MNTPLTNEQRQISRGLNESFTGRNFESNTRGEVLAIAVGQGLKHYGGHMPGSMKFGPTNKGGANDKIRPTTLARNVAQGKEFENVTRNELPKKGITEIQEQVTIKAENGVNTRIDFIGKDPGGNIVLTEAKSSATAPLTRNQKSAFPSIAQFGGTIVGEGKPGYKGGTIIPPTQVQVVRPNEEN